MKQIVFFLFLWLSTCSIKAQGLEITNGTITRSIEPTSFLELVISDRRLSERAECACMNVSGTLINRSKDSLTIKLNYFSASFDKVDLGVTSNIDFSQGNLQQQYAIKDIISLNKYKSIKQQKRKTNFSIFGGIFIGTGIVTAAQFLLGGNRQGRKNLLISGGAQIVTGITLLSFSTKKTYRFRNENQNNADVWQVK